VVSLTSIDAISRGRVRNPPGSLACRPEQAATRAVGIPLKAFLAYFSPQEQAGNHSFMAVGPHNGN
jgi:hypothetical protein